MEFIGGVCFRFSICRVDFFVGGENWQRRGEEEFRSVIVILRDVCIVAMATATSNSLLLFYRLSQTALGSGVSSSQGRNSVCCVVRPSLKPKTYSLGVQCFQGQPPAPVTYTDGGDLCAIRPVSDENATEKIVPKPLKLPTSALALADVIGTGLTVMSKLDDSKQSHTIASAEFFALCSEQLGLCHEIVGPPARFTVRPCILFYLLVYYVAEVCACIGGLLVFHL